VSSEDAVATGGRDPLLFGACWDQCPPNLCQAPETGQYPSSSTRIPTCFQATPPPNVGGNSIAAGGGQLSQTAQFRAERSLTIWRKLDFADIFKWEAGCTGPRQVRRTAEASGRWLTQRTTALSTQPRLVADGQDPARGHPFTPGGSKRQRVPLDQLCAPRHWAFSCLVTMAGH
jgi:hypothetical protein